MADDEARMSFTEHLGELRQRLIKSGVALILSVIVCYAFANTILQLIARPLRPIVADESASLAPGQSHDPQQQLRPWTVMNPLEPIMVKLKLAGYAGGVLAFPVILWQICAFVFPGLRDNEKRAVKLLLIGCSVLAVAGVAVAYFCVFPLVLPYLLASVPEGFEIQLRTNETVSLILKGLVAFAIAFQFPMVVMVLVYMGLLTPASLKRYRRVAIVGLTIVAAVFTPPDPFSLLIMLIPLVLLYEFSILISRLVVRKKAAG